MQIINDYFDLLAALAAHAKTNGLAGHKLSRYGGWWAFEHYDTGKGFDAGYKLWNNAANATNHLFFAYLRSQTPEPGSTNGVLDLPRSLQQLVDSVEYPPPKSTLIANDTTKVVMVVDVVSPTPFALLRRAKQFEYRDDDIALQHFAEFEDPVKALTEECRRVLRAISTTNQSQVSDAATSTSLKDPSWSRFEDIGFGSTFEDTGNDTMLGKSRTSTAQGINSYSRSSTNDLGRPTTPSWADFLSSGFVDENGKATAPMLLHPEKSLPPMSTVPRGQSSQSHRRDLDTNHLEPGELASIAKIELDDAFWWVWISSLAGEEPVARKAAFGRCALIETTLLGGQWMVMEEQVKGAAPDPVPGAYVAERKSFFSFTKKGRLGRRKSNIKKNALIEEPRGTDPLNRLTLDQDRQAKIQKAAAELARQKRDEETQASIQRRGRNDENAITRTTSIFTLGPMIKDEASPALQWTKQYDKKAIREQYLGNNFTGKGSSDFLLVPSGSGLSIKRSTSTLSVSKDLPPTPTSTKVVPVEKAPPSQHSETVPKVDDSSRRHEVVTDEPTLRSISSAQLEQAPQAPPAPPAATPAAPPVAILPEKTPSVTDLSQIQSKKSSESKRSIRSGKEKHTTEKGRVKKLGFNAPPPVATNRNGGIKKIIETLQRKPKNNSLPPDSPTNEDPAVAAARRALEGKPAKPGTGPTSPPLSPNHFAKFQNAAKPPSKESPVPGVDTGEQGPYAADNLHVDAEETTVPPPPVDPAPPVPSDVPVEYEAPAQSFKTVPEVVEPANDQSQQPLSELSQPKADGFESLSQTSSQEKASAAREFSRFDQGPLMEQPAFVPAGDAPSDDDEKEEVRAFEPPHRPQHQSVYSTVTVQTEGTDEDSGTDLAMQMSAHDRWAQIRRNAAERAARASEDQGRSRTETRTTDDGETSGEESKLSLSDAGYDSTNKDTAIESRVARIKARVAELTGNMEPIRR